MKLSPQKDGIELITLYRVEMEGCSDEDGINLYYKYVYYKNKEDIDNLEFKSYPLTEYTFSSFTLIILPKGMIYL